MDKTGLIDGIRTIVPTAAPRSPWPNQLPRGYPYPLRGIRGVR